MQIDEQNDITIRAFLDAIGVLVGGTVYAVLVAEPDGTPFFIGHDLLNEESLRDVLAAFAVSDWNASKSR